MQEVDEYKEVGHHQHQRHRDADVRDEAAARALADRSKRQHGVDERGHERAERDLSAPVADEVAQHPGAELGGRQGQRDDHDREHDADDRDDGRGDRGQDLPRGIGRPAEHPSGRVEHPVVRRPVQGVRAGEQDHRRGHLDRGDKPEVGTQHLAAPVRAGPGADHRGIPRRYRKYGMASLPAYATDADQASRLTSPNCTCADTVSAGRQPASRRPTGPAPQAPRRARPSGPEAHPAARPVVNGVNSRRRGRATASGQRSATATASPAACHPAALPSCGSRSASGGAPR